MKEQIDNLLLEACQMLYDQDKFKNRARMGHILGYFRQFSPDRTLEAQAIINPERFGKYAKKEKSDVFDEKGVADAVKAIETFNAKVQEVEQIDTEQEQPQPAAKKPRGRKAKDQCCG